MFTGGFFQKVELFQVALAFSRRCVAVLTASLALVLPATITQAHHSMSAFDKEQWFTRTGVLVRVEFVNPHVFLVVEIEDDEGAPETWRLEGPYPQHFHNVGYFKSDLENSLGKNVTVELSPARNGSHEGLLRQLTLASGEFISACPLQC